MSEPTETQRVVDAINYLLDLGVLRRYERPHQWPGCDGMMTCDCPPPQYRLQERWRAWMEAQR